MIKRKGLKFPLLFARSILLRQNTRPFWCLSRINNQYFGQLGHIIFLIIYYNELTLNTSLI